MPNWKNSKGGNLLKQELSELLILNSEEAILPDTLIRDEIYYHDVKANQRKVLHIGKWAKLVFPKQVCQFIIQHILLDTNWFIILD